MSVWLLYSADDPTCGFCIERNRLQSGKMGKDVNGTRYGRSMGNGANMLRLIRLCYKGTIIFKEKDDMRTPYEEMENQTETIGQATLDERRLRKELRQLEEEVCATNKHA